MKGWIKFIFLPLVVITLLQLISALIFGGFFNVKPGGWVSVLSAFVVHFIGGVTVYHLSLKNKVFTSAVYIVALSTIGVVVDLATSENTHIVMGETVKMGFGYWKHIATVLGLVLGAYGAYADIAEEASTEEKDTQ